MGAFQLRPNRFVERDIRMSDATAETPTSHTTSLPLRFIPRTAWNSILIGLVLVSAIACAGQRGSGSTDNLGGALVDASAIGILNVSEVMDGDIPSEIRDDFVYKWDEIEKYEAYLDELRTIVVVGSSNGDYSIFRGKIDFEAVRDALDDEDYQDDTYRITVTTVWPYSKRGTHGSPTGAPGRILKDTKGAPLRRLVEEVGGGWKIAGADESEVSCRFTDSIDPRECWVYFDNLRGCEGVAFFWRHR